MCVFTCRILHFSQFSMQLMKAYVAEMSWYRLYNENEGLSYTQGEAQGNVYSMNPSSNCVTGLYQNATIEIHLTKTHVGRVHYVNKVASIRPILPFVFLLISWPIYYGLSWIKCKSKDK